MPNTVLIHIKKIKSPEILRDALKHNLRQIARETSISSHIDPKRSESNLVLEGKDDPIAMSREAVSTVKQATGKKLRANGVFAVEVVISLPVNSSAVPTSFFEETLYWLHGYWDCPVVSAVVHLDEANPHMHVIVLPLRQGKMIGAALVGYKPQLAALKKNHHIEVANQYGFSQVTTVPRYRRFSVARQILGTLQKYPDWINHPSVEAELISVIAMRPAELLSVLGLNPKLS